jgi:hypothetical protein
MYILKLATAALSHIPSGSQVNICLLHFPFRMILKKGDALSQLLLNLVLNWLTSALFGKSNSIRSTGIKRNTLDSGLG